MGQLTKTREDLEQELRELRAQLTEAEETLWAIREGKVDALVVSTPEGQRIFTLQDADNTYRQIVEQMQEGAITLVGDGQITYSNRRFAELLKRPLEHIIGSHAGVYVIESDRHRFYQLVRQSVNGRVIGEVTMCAGDGSLIPSRISLSAMVLDQRTSICAVVTDLTERKRAEALLASEQFIRQLIDHSPIGVAVVRRDLRYVLANPAYQAIVNAPVVGRTIKEAFPPDVAQTIEPLVQHVLCSGQATEFREYEVPRHSQIWWNVSEIPLHDSAGNTEAVLLLAQEVTKQKLADETLRKSQAMLADAERVANIGSWEWDLRSGEVHWSDQMYRIFGQLRGSFIPTYDRFLTLIHPDDREYADQTIQSSLARGEWRTVEYRVFNSTGDPRIILAQADVTVDDERQPRRVVGTAIDITERKLTEQKLLENRKHLAWVLQTTGIGLWLNELPLGELNWDDRTRQLFFIPPGIEPTADMFFLRLHPEDQEPTRLAVEAALRDHTLYSIDHRAVDPATGTVRWIRSAGQATCAADGTPLRFDGINYDITERKLAEERIRTALSEKEVLLKEVHHRVKNNMQVVSSLLALHAAQLSDPVMRTVLQDVTHRVRSMALVHEKLYQSADMACVDFADYATSLLNYLWRAHGASATGICLKLDLEAVQISVNSAVPCGLILNELVSNSLKHAFPNQTQGEVSVSLRSHSQGQVCMRVRDSGIGLPVGFNWPHTEALGLRLVQMLAGQLQATVEVFQKDGTEFAVTFGEPTK
jgi:PAS domain S-box-containing protein